MCFRNYGLQKSWLDKCLKMLVSQDLSISNMLNVLKHSLILHNSTFKIFVDE